MADPVALADARVPVLLPLDQRVLDALAVERGRRGDRVAQLVHGSPAYRCDKCGDTSTVSCRPARDPLKWEARRPMRCLRLLRARTDDHDGEWCDEGRRIPVLVTTAEQRREVREVLRGLERVGRAGQRGGWWRRA